MARLKARPAPAVAPVDERFVSDVEREHIRRVCRVAASAGDLDVARARGELSLLGCLTSGPDRFDADHCIETLRVRRVLTGDEPSMTVAELNERRKALLS